jgi:hypothetical protein
VDVPAAAKQKLEARLPKGSSLFDGVLRTESDKEGVVACIDTSGKLGLQELLGRLQRFQKSGDLADVGELRYALARKVGDKTSVLMAWTEGSMPVLRMFPASGDAPGVDPVDVPRVPGMRRLLSTWENGEPYALALYSAPGQAPGPLAARYRSELTLAGWTSSVVPLPSAATGRALVARRGARTAIIRIASQPSSGTTVSAMVFD